MSKIPELHSSPLPIAIGIKGSPRRGKGFLYLKIITHFKYFRISSNVRIGY